MKIAVFYFSGTGNTKNACERLQVYMENRNNSVILYNIEAIQNYNADKILSIIENVDIVGLAYPVYGANLPKIVQDFINRLTNSTVKDKKIFILSTVGFINAYGPYIIKRMLGKSGFILKWHYVYKTVDNTKIRKVSTDMLEKKYNNQLVKFEKFCNSILNDEKYFNGIGPWLIGGYFVRRILKKPIANHYRNFFVDIDICLKCNMCINNCPENAIINDKDNFIFLESCTTCFRCKNLCPVNAIKEKRS